MKRRESPPPPSTYLTLATVEAGGPVSAAKTGGVPWLLARMGITLWIGASSAYGLQLLSSNQLVFVNVDHAPMGTCSTINYGYKGQICGVGMSTGVYPYWNGGGGVVIALS